MCVENLGRRAGAGMCRRPPDHAVNHGIRLFVFPSCLYRKSNSAIMVMKSAEDGRRYDAAHVLDRPMDRCVLPETDSRLTMDAPGMRCRLLLTTDLPSHTSGQLLSSPPPPSLFPSSHLPIAPLATNSLNHLAGKRKQLAHTASFAAFTGRALIIFRAGLASNTVGSFVNGLMPARSFVAGFLITTNFAKPGNKNAPFFFNSL